MGRLFYENSKFIYEDQNKKEVLLNCTDFLANKSRVSMHRLEGNDYLIIPELLIRLTEKERKKGNNFEVPAALMDILLVSRLIQTSYPVKILEYGSMQGQLSWHLAEITGVFHEESSLVCAYDTMDLEWMEQISKVEHLPKLSFFAGDYGCFQLQEGYFDIVIINGMVNYLQPKDVIEEALRLAADNGILLCYANAAPLLESTFKLYFKNRKEYEITPSQNVFLANVRDKDWPLFL